MFKDYPDIVDFKQFIEMINVKRTKGYEILRNKEIRYKKVGKLYRIPKKNVIEYLTNIDGSNNYHVCYNLGSLENNKLSNQNEDKGVSYDR